MSNQAMDWLAQNSGGSGAPGVAFKQQGAKIIGKISADARKVETEFGDRLVIDLIVAAGSTATLGDGSPVNEGDDVTLWVKPGAMAQALKGACTTAGVSGISVGDTLAFAYTGDGHQPKAGFNAPKQYACKVQPAVGIVGVDDLI